MFLADRRENIPDRLRAANLLHVICARNVSADRDTKNSKIFPKKNFPCAKKKLDNFFSNYVTLIEATKALSYFNHEKQKYGNSKKSNS